MKRGIVMVDGVLCDLCHLELALRRGAVLTPYGGRIDGYELISFTIGLHALMARINLYP
jgi:hypothetical protein